jgi:hypothetical protein
MIMKIYQTILLFVFSGTICLAQPIRKSSVQPVDSDGYYNIELTGQIVSHSINLELKDLKIIDENNKEVPYFLRPTGPIREINRFETYHLNKNETADSLNIIIIDNDKTENIRRFYVMISGADVDKYASIRGSNNQSDWYIVKQKTKLSSYYSGEENNEMLILDFPQGNYRHYEIRLSNDQKSPLKVLKVGKIQNSNIYGQFSAIDPGKFIQKDSSDRKTYLSFPELREPILVNKTEFAVNYKSDYFRHARITTPESDISLTFDLSSKNENVFFTDRFVIYPGSMIVIENYNNPPLIIDSVKLFGLKRYLCAYLEKGHNYSILIGKKDDVPANYDIEYFQNDIPNDLPIVMTETPVIFSAGEPATERDVLLIEKPWFLWSVIIVVGVFLVFVCVKMIRDLKKRK